MAWGYENTKLNMIENDIAAYGAEMNEVFQHLSNSGLGNIFRDAVEGGVTEASYEGLDAEVAADLKEVFNGLASLSVVCVKGVSNVRICFDNNANTRAILFKKLFERAARKGNRTAFAVKADVAKLAFLTGKIEILKKEKAFIIANAAPALKVA
jgi:hypothetical protein